MQSIKSKLTAIVLYLVYMNTEWVTALVFAMIALVISFIEDVMEGKQ